MNISLSAEKIAEIGGFSISNSFLTTWVAMLVLIVISLLATKNIKLIPTGIQNVVEALIESLYNLIESIAGDKGKYFFPIVTTFFLFILTSNWLGLVPGANAIGLFRQIHGEKEFIPLFRSPSADLNTTLALALISVTFIQIYGVKWQGPKYFSKFVNFSSPINFYVGILELISEIAKIISFSFRLFGNIFAGEVLLLVIAFLIPVVAPGPFLLLEIFVGFIQAFVFSILTLVFLNVATTKHDESH